MKAQPLVSIIVVCYNQSAYVVDCLESIRLQTYKNIELIIIDDCSQDDSVAAIESWIAAHKTQPVFISHKRNQGVCKTFNEALSYASGKYISIIAADDVYLPDKTETQVTLFETLPNKVGLIYSDALQIDASGNLLPRNFINTHRPLEVMPQGDVFDVLLRGNFIPAMSTMVRRECYDTVGLYDEQLSYEDFDMWLRIARRYEFCFSSLVLAKYRVLPTSMSRTIHAAGRWDLLKSDFRIYEKYIADKISSSQRSYLRNALTAIGQQMYANKYAGHRHYLAKLVRYDLRPYTVAMLLFSLAAIPFESLCSLVRLYRSFREKLFAHGYAQGPDIVKE